jgi:hypothetical protein
MGMYFTVTCSESVPFISEDEISRETRNTFTGESRIRTHQQACREWARAEAATSYFPPPPTIMPHPV